MKTTKNAIANLIKAGAVRNISANPGIIIIPLDSTIVARSRGLYGMNGAVIRNNKTGELSAAVAGFGKNIIIIKR